MDRPAIGVAAFDLHFPYVSWPTWNVMMKFIDDVQPSLFYFGGDNFDLEEISHHTRNKPRLRDRGGYKRNEQAFETKILKPLEEILPRRCKKVYQLGNHEDWEMDLLDEQPELEGVVGHHLNLGIEDRGWQVIDVGKSYEHGKLALMHGDSIAGGVNHARKALELYCQSVVYGHRHQPQSATKQLPNSRTDKWMSWSAPCMCELNPRYLENKPTAWLNGFVVIEFYKQLERFNVYPIITFDGEFSYGGRVYRAA